MATEAEHILNTRLQLIKHQIAVNTSSIIHLVPQRASLQVRIARDKHRNARQVKFLREQLDAHVSRKDELERRKKGIEEIESIRTRMEELDQYLRTLNGFRRVLDGAFFLAVAIRIAMYFKETDQQLSTGHVGAFFLAFALRIALYFSEYFSPSLLFLC